MRSRAKPTNKTYAGTGERPISISTEKKLDESVAKATIAKEQRITVLEQENARLQLQLEQKREEIEAAEAAAKRAAELKEEADATKLEAAKQLKAAEKAKREAERLQEIVEQAKKELKEEIQAQGQTKDDE